MEYENNYKETISNVYGKQWRNQACGPPRVTCAKGGMFRGGTFSEEKKIFVFV